MGQSQHDCAGSARVCAAALLLVLHMTGLVVRAAATEFSADEPIAVNTLAPVEVSDPFAPLSAPSRTWSDDFWTRSQLTGDWEGSRSGLAESGVTFFGDITQYYQGVTAGGLSQQFKYGGRGDYLIDVDSRKLGLWEGGRLDLRGETRLGQDTNRIDGSVAPSNFAMALPLPNQNVTALTGVQYTQDLSENVSVFLGKLNLLDGTPTSYAKGLRLNYFWNAAMQTNLSRVYLLPSTLGTGLAIRDEGDPVFNFYLLDTHFTPTTSGFSTLFANGVVTYGEYRLRTNWLDLPGHSTVGFLYSSATRTTLDTNPYVLLPGRISGEALPSKDTAWTVLYRVDQVLYADAANADRTWTLNSDIGLTDGNPNPIHWFANLSLVGSSPIRSREQDTIGVGYYHLGVSSLAVLQTLGFGAENGVELFYNAAITPWFHLTPDLQILDPARQATPTAVVVGIRGRLSF